MRTDLCEQENAWLEPPEEKPISGYQYYIDPNQFPLTDSGDEASFFWGVDDWLEEADAMQTARICAGIVGVPVKVEIWALDPMGDRYLMPEYEIEVVA